MRRLPVNLASEPLERRRLARRLVGATALVALAITAVHAALAWSLVAADRPPGPAAGQPPVAARLLSWEREVGRLAAVATPDRVGSTADAVAVADDAIGRRAFPWADLFAVLEEALPDDVRLERVQPASSPQGVRVDLVATARERAGLVEFLQALEETDRLRDVFPVLEERSPQGDWRLTLRVRHAGGPEERP